MYHLDFESLGQPLCKASGFSRMSILMAAIWNIQPSKFAMDGNETVFWHTSIPTLEVYGLAANF